jgi:hypothetical protein
VYLVHRLPLLFPAAISIVFGRQIVLLLRESDFDLMVELSIKASPNLKIHVGGTTNKLCLHPL